MSGLVQRGLMLAVFNPPGAWLRKGSAIQGPVAKERGG